MHLVSVRPWSGKSLLVLSGWSFEDSDTGWVWIGMRKYYFLKYYMYFNCDVRSDLPVTPLSRFSKALRYAFNV